MKRHKQHKPAIFNTMGAAERYARDLRRAWPALEFVVGIAAGSFKFGVFMGGATVLKVKRCEFGGLGYQPYPGDAGFNEEWRS